MKINKKSFILYTDTYESIKMLPDLEKGRLLTAIFEYVITGKEIPTKNTTGMAFSFIKKQLDRDAKKWNALVSRNQANILSRWKKTKLKVNTKNTTGKTGIPNTLDNDNDTVNVNDNDTLDTSTTLIEKEPLRVEENKSTSKVGNSVVKTHSLGFGNPDIETCRAYFLHTMTLPSEDGQTKWNRIHWQNLIREAGRGVDGVKKLIDLASQDDFYKNNITSARDLWNFRVKLMTRKRGTTQNIVNLNEEVL